MTTLAVLVMLAAVGVGAYRAGHYTGRTSAPPRLPPMSPELTKRYIIEQLRR